MRRRSRLGVPFVTIVVVLLALVIVPAPVLPPHRFAEVVQAMLGIQWQAGYLIAVVALQAAFYGGLGMLAAVALDETFRGPRWSKIVLVPLAIVGAALVIRSLKVGHLPLLTNALVPVTACLIGAGFALGVVHQGWRSTLVVAAVTTAIAGWGLMSDAPARLTTATEMRLRQLVAGAKNFPDGEARFAALMQAAFAAPPSDARQGDPIDQNRAAILALGIAVGHERLARLMGPDGNSELVRRARAFGVGATLRSREDWARHFSLSAGLTVLENPLVSDAGGLMKEQLDALARGSGFSFADLAADRAGVRFAMAATRSEVAAKAMQARLHAGFVVDEFFPDVADLPEHLTLEQFRRDYRSVGSRRYRALVDEIESRLDGCSALTPPRLR